MQDYDPKQIESKWQKAWAESGIYWAKKDSDKPKWYSLVEFPYPSGEGLHVGHPRPYIGMDVVSRKRRMEGYNVLYPIGYDAFGLPAENYAIKTGTKPADITAENIIKFRKQIQAMGVSFDWSREINTTNPAYYKWTQWLFLKFLEHGLAYKAKMQINWCPKDRIGLANEEVINGHCERCGTAVEKREKEQWMLKITAYADKLDKDLDTVDYPERVKAQQRNWIGRSEGASINFAISNFQSNSNEQFSKIEIFTTRPDTIFGTTYLVLAPEHPAIENWKSQIKNWNEVEAYIQENKAEIDRIAEGREKTGVELKGVKAVNPATKEEIPVWIADYVLPHYGTGAIMAVPAHDERDYQFAKKFGLEVREVVVPDIIDERNPPVPGKKSVARKNVHPIVRDPATDKYLALKWKKFDWTTFPMGGIDEGEDPETAARREVLEETGFKNLKLVKVIPGQVRAEYFAAHKDENRIAYTTAVVFDLTDHEQAEIDQKEKDSFDIIWLDRSELNYDHMTHAEANIWNARLDAEFVPYTGAGVLINSGDFTGQESEDIKDTIIAFVGGEKKVTFKLRDWVFSRQRYWGEPIPVVMCEKCGIVPVPEKDLPVLLPDVEHYEPTDTGESPLANITDWVNTTCPKCGGPAKRETDTMPNWAGSSWYFLRYTDPHNNKEFASQEALKHWMPVDWYNGGMEHTTLHLLYSRFWNKFFYDIGLVPVSEPYKKRTSHGFILAENGEKMSKSRGNVINPDTVIAQFGADTFRAYEMFIGPFEQAITWSESSIVGVRRFIERVWKLGSKISNQKSQISKDAEDDRLMHETIKKVSEDIEVLGFNTAISALMQWVNALDKRGTVSAEEYKNLILLLAPFAPHVTEELWNALGEKGSVHEAPWPTYDESKLVRQFYNMAVQVNGKVRATLEVSSSAGEEEVKSAVLALPEVQKWLNGASPKKVIVVLGRIVNVVV